jgi:hypothetical protein
MRRPRLGPRRWNTGIPPPTVIFFVDSISNLFLRRIAGFSHFAVQNYTHNDIYFRHNLTSKPTHIHNCGKMNTTESKATDGVSPCGQRQYMLLHSPKAGIPSKSKLPFLILFIGVGIVVTRSWSDISARMIPGCSALPKSEPITYTESIERQEDAHIRKHTANASRPLIWLMSFPASAKFVLRVDTEVIACLCQHILFSFTRSRIRGHPTRAILCGQSREKIPQPTTEGNTLARMERAYLYSKKNPEAHSGLPRRKTIAIVQNRVILLPKRTVEVGVTYAAQMGTSRTIASSHADALKDIT